MDRVAEVSVVSSPVPPSSGRIREARPMSPTEVMTGSAGLAEVRDLQRQRGLRALHRTSHRGRAQGGSVATRGWDVTWSPTPGQVSMSVRVRFRV